MEKSRGPYKLNALAERVALAALRNDMPWVNEHVALAVMLRDRLSDALRAMGLAPMPSAANFVCVPIAQCVAVGQAMRARGVAVRPFPALPHVGDALRISVGPWPLMERMLAAPPDLTLGFNTIAIPTIYYSFAASSIPSIKLRPIQQKISKTLLP